MKNFPLEIKKHGHLVELVKLSRRPCVIMDSHSCIRFFTKSLYIFGRSNYVESSYRH